MNTKKTIDYFLHIFIRETPKKNLNNEERKNYFYFYSEGYAKAMKDILLLQEAMADKKKKKYYLHWKDCCEVDKLTAKYAYNQERINCPRCIQVIYGHIPNIFIEKMSEVILRAIEKWIPNATGRYFEKKDMKRLGEKSVKQILDESEQRRKKVEEDFKEIRKRS